MRNLIGTLLCAGLLLLAGCPRQDATTADTTVPPGGSNANADTLKDIEAIDTTPDQADKADAVVETGQDEGGVDPKSTPAGMLVGQAAPDFTLTDYDGKEHHLADYTAQGKVVIVEWFSPKCGAVNVYYAAEKPEFMQSFRAGIDGKDVVWLSVNSSGEGQPGFDAAENKAWFEKHGKTNPVLIDASGATGKAYGVENTPHLFVIGKDGKVVYSGGFDEAGGGGDAPRGTNYVLAAVDGALNGTPVEVTATRAVG